ncbi:MAG: hypothetical protein ABUS79_00870 [Pseudomonadota bacterium]
MSHRCRCLTEGNRQRNDACCQHGADVLVPEREAILRRSAQVASVMRESRRDPRTWFDDREPGFDPEAPGGIVIRTATSDPNDDTSGCVFLEHTGERGCGLHRAALQYGFEPARIKPRVCHLYPLSWNDGWLGLSEDFDRYSCATDGSASVYRVMRAAVEETFGAGLIAELDRAEAQVHQRRLPVVSRDATALDGE